MYMAEKIEQKVTRAQGWKKKLSETLKDLGFIDGNFTGKVVININQGEARTIEQVKYHK